MTVASGIVALLDTLDGLRPVEGWPNTINTDAAIVEGPIEQVESDMAGCGLTEVYGITLLFSMSGGIERARDRLMPYLTKGDPKEIRSTLYASSTLSGNVECFLWRGMQAPPGRIQIFGKGLQAEVPVEEFYGTELRLEVFV